MIFDPEILACMRTVELVVHGEEEEANARFREEDEAKFEVLNQTHADLSDPHS